MTADTSNRTQKLSFWQHFPITLLSFSTPMFLVGGWVNDRWDWQFAVLSVGLGALLALSKTHTAIRRHRRDLAEKTQ